jgi:hypothetical protein
MLLFLAAVGVVVWILRVPLIQTFWHNPVINGAILVNLVLGLLYIFRQVFLLGREVWWLEAASQGQPPDDTVRLRLLAPMASMMRDHRDRLRLSPMATRSLLDGIAARLDEQREISRYAIGLLIFLGLLGTFWGLLDTVGSVGEAISKLQPGGNSTEMFGRLKESLEGPLKGMGTAFGASLFGLSGSLVLGFMELQAGQAQNRFFNDLEDWLSAQTRLSGGTLNVDGEQPLPAYVEALLEQSAESIDKLQRTLARTEEQRSLGGDSMAQLGERLATLADSLQQQQASLQQQQAVMARLAETGGEIRETMAWLAERIVHVTQQSQPQPTDDVTRAHLRSIESYSARLLEETIRGRTALADELRGEFKLLARTLAARSTGGAGLAPPSATAPSVASPARPPIGPAGPRPPIITPTARSGRDRPGE